MPTWFRRAARVAALVLLGLVMLLIAGWSVLALLYFDHANPVLRKALALLFALAALAAIVGLTQRRWRRRAVGGFFALFALLLLCWFSVSPSNDRDWQPDVAVLPSATVDGDLITVHNIRNIDYRSETDFTIAYYDRTFHLSQLDSIDVAAVYWMGPAIAHIFVSFGFADGNYLAVSIEARKEKGEGYSSIQGFFRQYELYYAVADERDAIRLRSNYRKDPPEDVYLYRVQTSPANRQRLFLEYLREINSLASHAEFYNTLTTNCTSNIWMHTRVNPEHLPYSWKILLSGYVPEYLYEKGKLEPGVPFEELRRRSYVNERAHAADQAADFSQRIRALPAP
jgi:hypothetical protein